jgi:hypothetical protein
MNFHISPFIIILLAGIIITSCNKDNDAAPETATPTYSNYSALAVGNYWVYENFRVDSSGIAITTNTFDSCYVEKDTIIWSRTFYKVYRPTILADYLYLSDSLHYIIEPGNKIIFSSIDFTSLISSRYSIDFNGDTLYYTEWKMADSAMNITVPAGTFLTVNSKETFYMTPMLSMSGSVRYMNHLYAAGVGLVAETKPFFASDPLYTERRLVRYYVQ